MEREVEEGERGGGGGSREGGAYLCPLEEK